MYLDNAATSFPKPSSVYDATDHWMRRNGTAYGRGQHGAGEASRRIVEQCREQVARLLGVESSSHVVFTQNCTDSLNMVLRGLLRAGDRVVSTTLEHNSVLRPLTQLQSEFELTTDLASFDPETGQLDLTELSRLLDTPSRLVVFSHASNVTGCVQPAEDIIARAHSAGALVLLDAAQTAGHMPFDMKRLNADFVAAAGHKGLLGPLGTGILAMRPGLESQVYPIRCGGTGTSSESREQPTAMPSRFESGNLNMPGLAGLHAATAWLLEETVEAVHQRITLLANRLRDGLRLLPRVQLYSDSRGEAAAWPRVGVISFNIRDTDCRDAAMILDQSFGIQCRSGLHCAPLAHQTLGTISSGGTIRFSPGPFTTPDDIEAAISAVAAIADS